MGIRLGEHKSSFRALEGCTEGSLLERRWHKWSTITEKEALLPSGGTVTGKGAQSGHYY